MGNQEKEIIPENNLTPSSFDKWVNQSQNFGSFKKKDKLMNLITVKGH